MKITVHGELNIYFSFHGKHDLQYVSIEQRSLTNLNKPRVSAIWIGKSFKFFNYFCDRKRL